MIKKYKYYGPFFIIIASVMLGIDGGILVGIYSKTFQFYDVKFIVFTAHFFPTVFLSIFFYKKFKMFKIFSAADIFYFILIALLGGAIGTFSIIKALQLSDFKELSVVILLQKLQPIFAIIMSAIVLNEYPSKKFFIVAGIAIISSYFFTFGFKSPLLLEKNNLKACFFSLLAAFSYGSALVFGKKVLHKYDFFTGTFYRFFFTSIIVGISLLFSDNMTENIESYIHNKSLFYFALFASLWGVTEVFTYYVGLKNTPAALTSIFEMAYPLTVILLDKFINHKVFTSIEIFSILFLLGSIIYLNLNGQSMIKKINV